MNRPTSNRLAALALAAAALLPAAAQALPAVQGSADALPAVQLPGWMAWFAHVLSAFGG